MHVALLANSAWLDDELTQFRRLVVGLFDEQVRVAQVVPEDLQDQAYSPFGARLTWRDTRWARSRRRRLISLLEPLNKLDVNLIHALDGRLWDASVRLSQELQVPAILTTSCGADVGRLKRLRRHVNSGRLIFTAATKPLAQALEDYLGDTVVVEIVRPGVHLASGDRSSQGASALSAVITGNGEADADYEELFAALPLVLLDHPHAQFFLDCQGSDQHALWQMANRFELMSNMSMVPSRIGHSELLLGADVLIQPQSLGQARTLTLQAMAQSMTVIARKDAWLDYLIDDQTAWVVETGDDNRWTDLLRQVIERPHEARALGDSAQQWVRQNHRPSTQIARTLDVYRRASGESIKFPS